MVTLIYAPEDNRRLQRTVHVRYTLIQIMQIITSTPVMLKNASDEETMNNTQTFYWFSKFKSGVTSVIDAEHLQNSSPNKTHRNVACIKKPAHGTDESLSLSWLVSCKSHLEHSKAFWHKIWICDRLPQNLCLISWVASRSRARTMSVCARTLRKNYKETHHFFQGS